MTRILIASPVREPAPVVAAFLGGLAGLDPAGAMVDWLLADDCDDPKASAALRAAAVPGVCIRVEEVARTTDRPPPNDGETTHRWTERAAQWVAAVKDALLAAARAGAYDYALCVDADLVLHPDTLRWLLAAGKDITSAVFWTRWEQQGPELPNVWLRDQYMPWVQPIGATEAQIQEATREAAALRQQLRQPGVYRVGGLGACTLISRRALEAGVAFAHLDNLSWWGEDRHFCLRARALGLDLWADTHAAPFHLYREADLQAYEAAQGVADRAIQALLTPQSGSVPPMDQMDPQPETAAGGTYKTSGEPALRREDPACPLCGSPSSVLAAYPTHRLWSCSKCGVGFQDDAARAAVVAALPPVYDEAWTVERDAARGETLRDHVAFHVTLLQAFAPEPGTLLEIGAGTGEFARGASAAGWAVAAMEPSEAGRRYAEVHHGLKLLPGAWPQDAPIICFDAVVALHVLEHSPDPAAFLRAAAEHLEPGGLLLVALPNLDGPVNRLHGAGSFIYGQADHLWHFRPAHVRQLVEAAGLRVRCLFTRQPWNHALRLVGGRGPEEVIDAVGRAQKADGGHEIVCIAERGEKARREEEGGGRGASVAPVAAPTVAVRAERPRIALSMAVGNERGRWLPEVLRRAAPVATGGAKFIDDASDDGTSSTLVEMRSEFWPYGPCTIDRNWERRFGEEWQLRRQQWDTLAEFRPEWVLALDADQLLPSDAADRIFAAIAQHPDAQVLAFPEYDMWSETHYRDDDLWAGHRRHRPFLVRWKPNAVTWRLSPIHCGTFPLEVLQGRAIGVDIRIQHMGWARPEDRIAKQRRYLEADPDGRWGGGPAALAQYRSITDPTPNLVQWEP